MPEWKKNEFASYPAKNLQELIPKLNESGLDLLRVHISLIIENAGTRSEEKNYGEKRPKTLIF